VLLVCVAGLADAPLELHAAALLHDVRGFVCRGVEARGRGERNVVPDRVGFGTDRAARDRGRSADVRLDAADVVPAEQALDPVHVGQWAAFAGDPLRGRFPDRTAVGCSGTVRGTLHRQMLGERPLAGIEPRRVRATRTPLSARTLSLIESTTHSQFLQARCASTSSLAAALVHRSCLLAARTWPRVLEGRRHHADVVAHLEYIELHPECAAGQNGWLEAGEADLTPLALRPRSSPLPKICPAAPSGW
jgi:hypothetical protein